jgi:hypothetical protein
MKLKILILTAVWLLGVPQISAQILSADGNWSLHTWGSNHEIFTAEVASVGSVNWASGNQITERTAEAIFSFNLSGIDEKTILELSLLVYGGTSFDLPLQSRIDLFGIGGFEAPPTESYSRFVGDDDSAYLISEGVLLQNSQYSEGWYEFTSLSLNAFVRSELISGRTGIGFRLSPETNGVDNTAASPFYIYQDIPDDPSLGELSPKLSVTVIPEPSVFVYLIFGLGALVLLRSINKKITNNVTRC